MDRYFLATDSSGHWFVVPCSKKEEWFRWADLDEDNDEAWDAPDFARVVGGAPTLVTFSNPEIA